MKINRLKAKDYSIIIGKNSITTLSYEVKKHCPKCKKIAIIITLVICFVLFGTFWNIVSQGYDRQNQVILFIKKILPSHLLRDIKQTIFFIPDLKEKNRTKTLIIYKFLVYTPNNLFFQMLL